MEKHQVNLKYRVFSCIIALSLIFGISAMPAFAAPDSDASEGVSAQVDGEQDTQSEIKTLTPAKTQAVSSGATDSDWGADAKKKAEQGSAEQSELSGIEKVGAVVGAESELIGTQATGNKVAAQEELDEMSDPKDLAKSKIRAAILASFFGSYDNPRDASLIIIKTFPATDEKFLTEQGVDGDTAPYTVEYEIKGAYLSEQGWPIYKDNDNNWFCVDPEKVSSEDMTNVPVNDLKHRALYYYVDENNPDTNGETKKLFSKDDKGIYDTDNDGDYYERASLYLDPEKNVNDQCVLVAVNDNDTYGYVYNDANKNVFYIGTGYENVYMSVMKVKCEENDEGRIIGTVVKDISENGSSAASGEGDAVGAQSDNSERFLFPEDCGLEAGGEYYIGILDETDNQGDTQYIVLDSKKLDLKSCTVGNMPEGPLKRAEVRLDESTITIPITTGTVRYPLSEDESYTLPYPAEYTITEKTDPSYTFVKSYFDGSKDVDLGNPAVIKLMDGNGHKITFVNKLDPNSDSPNLSIVNEYTYDGEQNKVIVQKKATK